MRAFHLLATPPLPFLLLLQVIQTSTLTDNPDHSANSSIPNHPDTPLTVDNANNCARNLDTRDNINLDIRLGKVKVPGQVTTYMCQIFDLNIKADLDLHMIAVLPLIDAKAVVHHIILFGCDPRASAYQDTGIPEVCGIMPPETCRSLIGTWTMGSTGDCAHPEMGFRVGPRGYRQVFMQVHFNNPKLLTGLTDRSGLRLYLTKYLRPNDAGMLIVGQRSMQIDPVGYEQADRASAMNGEHVPRYLEDNVTFSSECPSRCTHHMLGEKGIFITTAVNHMHTLGISQRIEVYRNGTLVQYVTNQERYSYDHPVIYTFKEPIHVLPGDELKTTCVYKRPDSGSPVCFGEATSDEMCFGFLTYFPSKKLTHPWCTSMGSVVSCDRHIPQLGRHPISDCRWWEFRNISLPETKLMFGRVLFSCYSSKGTLQCSDDCKSLVTDLMTHPCLQNDMGSYMLDRIKQSGKSGQMLMDALVTCSCRDFRYCERKLPKGFLGSQQSRWCPSGAGSFGGGRWLWVLVWSSIVMSYCNLLDRL